MVTKLSITESMQKSLLWLSKGKQTTQDHYPQVLLEESIYFLTTLFRYTSSMIKIISVKTQCNKSLNYLCKIQCKRGINAES